MAQAPVPGRADPDGRAAAWRRRLRLAIGPLILLLILWMLDPRELFQALRRAEPLPLLAAYLMPLPAIALRALRWRLLLGRRGAPWRGRELLALYAQSIAAGVATPGRLGDLAKGALVSGRGVGLARGLWSALLDRLADLGFLALLASGAAALHAAPQLGRGALLAPVALSLPAGSAALAFLSGPGAGRWAARLSALLGRRYSLEIPPDPGTGAGGALGCSLLTLASWALTYAANDLYCASLGLDVGYLEIAGISAVTSLVAALPISIAGAGTRDAALIVLLAPYGATPAEAVALSALMLSNVLFVGALCALAYLWTPPAPLTAPEREAGPGR
jgi:uncharacterized membrane protein YbhN (UPF0104 family)